MKIKMTKIPDNAEEMKINLLLDILVTVQGIQALLAVKGLDEETAQHVLDKMKEMNQTTKDKLVENLYKYAKAKEESN